MHRRYVFRWDYLSKIEIMKILDRVHSGRLAVFLNYLLFFEMATIARGWIRSLKRKLFAGNCFET